jgi:hypothetical protein
MKKQVVGVLALSLIVGSGLFGTPQGAVIHQTGDENRITIRIHNYALVPPSVLRQAEQTAGSVLREAKVDSAWVECQTVPSSSTEVACTRPVDPSLLERRPPRPLHTSNWFQGIPGTGKHVRTRRG